MVGPLNARETDPTARKTTDKAPSIPVIAGVCVLLAIVAASATGALAEPPAAAPADALNTLKADLENLSTRLKQLQERVGALSNKPRPSSDLDAIRTQIDGLAKAAEALAPLAKKAETLDDQLAAANKQVASFRERITAVKEQRKQAADAAAAAVATTEDEIAKGIEAFKASRFKEANDLFQALTVSRPEDARVWYYAALSHGLATTQWKEETIGLFNKAVEREKAGTPDKAKIDASLATVTEPSVKRWVDHFRKLAQR